MLHNNYQICPFFRENEQTQIVKIDSFLFGVVLFYIDSQYIYICNIMNCQFGVRNVIQQLQVPLTFYIFNERIACFVQCEI